MHQIFASVNDGAIEPICCCDEGIKKTYRFSFGSEIKDADCLNIELPMFDAQAGTDGYYVIPYAKCCFITEFKERKNSSFLSTQHVMPMFGAKLKDKTYLITVDQMQYDFMLEETVKDGRYSLRMKYDLTKIDIYENIVLSIYEVGGADKDYNDIAHAYQKLQVECKGLVPLCERAKTNEVISYAENMPIIRVRMAWKPVPTPILEQTPETEPQMHVACTFAQVEELIDALISRGLEKAEICLVGWNYRGHDGRWPQMFPVEPELGGEDGLKKLIAHAERMGYRVVCHTNSSDMYRISEDWDENAIIRNKNGQLSVNENAWSGGRMYNICPKCFEDKFLERNNDLLSRFAIKGFSYIDVLTTVPPRTCYHPEHRMTAKQSVESLNRILRKTQSRFGGIASEGGFDFAAGNLDFALYVAFNLLSGTPILADEIIPLWQLVYHGYIFSNPTAETVNYSIKDPVNRLRFFEFGGIPTFYLFSRFVGENGMKNWMGDEDLFCDSPETIEASAAIITDTVAEYCRFSGSPFAFMTRHDKLSDGVYCTRYSDGCETVVNYSPSPFVYKNKTVQPKDILRFSK